MSKQHIGVSKGFQTLWRFPKAAPLVGLGEAQRKQGEARGKRLPFKIISYKLQVLVITPKIYILKL